MNLSRGRHSRVCKHGLPVVVYISWAYLQTLPCCVHEHSLSVPWPWCSPQAGHGALCTPDTSLPINPSSFGLAHHVDHVHSNFYMNFFLMEFMYLMMWNYLLCVDSMMPFFIIFIMVWHFLQCGLNKSNYDSIVSTSSASNQTKRPNKNWLTLCANQRWQ